MARQLVASRRLRQVRLLRAATCYGPPCSYLLFLTAMPTLDLRQARRLRDALGPLYHDALPPAAQFARLADTVTDLLGSDMLCLDLFSDAGRMHNLGGNSQSAFTPERIRYLTERLDEHPLFNGIVVERYDSPLKISDFYSLSRLRRLDLFNDFYRPINIWHQLIVGFQVPGVGFAACSLSRSRRDFTEAERVLLAFVQPHLTALLQLAQPPRWQVPAGLGLTPREADILRGLAQGHPDKVIAQRYGISPRTVQVHLHRLYAKLGVDNRTAAVLLLAK